MEEILNIIFENVIFSKILYCHGEKLFYYKRTNVGWCKGWDYIIGVGPPPCGKTKKGRRKKEPSRETNNKRGAGARQNRHAFRSDLDTSMNVIHLQSSCRGWCVDKSGFHGGILIWKLVVCRLSKLLLGWTLLKVNFTVDTCQYWLQSILDTGMIYTCYRYI